MPRMGVSLSEKTLKFSLVRPQKPLLERKEKGRDPLVSLWIQETVKDISLVAMGPESDVCIEGDIAINPGRLLVSAGRDILIGNPANTSPTMVKADKMSARSNQDVKNK